MHAKCSYEPEPEPTPTTPTDKGDEVKPTELRAQTIGRMQSELLSEFNAFDGQGSRSTLAALQGVQPGTGPVLVVGSGLDTTDPLKFEALAFDASIGEVVAALEAGNELPKGLAGRSVWLVFTTATGAQEPLRAPHKEYRADLYTAIVTAAGGSVERVLETDAAPAGTGGTAPMVPIPPPPGTFVPEPEMVPSVAGPQDPAVVQRCVLPVGVLFHGDKALLLDEDAARGMVQTCLGKGVIEQVELIGHTAKTSGSSAPDNPVAMDLSQERADTIAQIVIDEFHIDPTRVTARGVGATQPLVEPDNNPSNRAVEVIVTYAA